MIGIFLFSMLSLFSIGKGIPGPYHEEYVNQPFDHFNFFAYGDGTFRQRYLYSDQWWNPGKGPIFFYAGNEDTITDFWNNTGFIHEIAPQFQALVLFAEHRYYGESMPFGSRSLDTPFIGLLSIEQVLADYAFLIAAFKKKMHAENCKVIAFGGSYGGMLAAYMRYKFPNLVRGAIASSAPIHQLSGLVPFELFYQTITKDFRDVSPECEQLTTLAFTSLKQLSLYGQTGYDQMSRDFHLCKPISSPAEFDYFLRWITAAYIDAAMANYPYPSSALGSFPAFPVNVMCSRIMTAETLMAGIYDAIALTYNQTQNLPCNDMSKQFILCGSATGCGAGPTSRAWDYQTCTEVNLVGGPNGKTDMFPELPFTPTMRDQYCQKAWGVRPNPDWLRVMYWGDDISSSSNIVFSNGDMDPWGAGGITSDISDSIHGISIKGGAHHLDLKASNPADPQSVTDARNFIVKCIREWLSQ